MDLPGPVGKPQPCGLNALIADLLDEFEALAIAAEILLTADIRGINPYWLSVTKNSSIACWPTW